MKYLVPILKKKMNKTFKLCLILILIFLAKSLYSQDYYSYYLGIDSAKYYNSKGEFKKADSLFLDVFSKYNGFPEDYEKAFYASINSSKKIRKEYLTGYIKNHGSRVDLRETLKNFQKNFGYKEDRVGKLYRNTEKFKINHKNSRIIRRLMLKDIWSRRMLNLSNFSKRDSLNAIVIEKRFQKDSTLFCSRYYKNFQQQFLQILLFHQGYDNWGNNLELLRKEIKKGNIYHDFLWYLIERDVVWSGNLFELRNDSLILLKNKNVPICNPFNYYYYSILGQFELFDTKTYKNYMIPLNPSYSLEMVNKLRKYIYYTPIELYYEIKKGNVSFNYNFCEIFPLH